MTRDAPVGADAEDDWEYPEPEGDALEDGPQARAGAPGAELAVSSAEPEVEEAAAVAEEDRLAEVDSAEVHSAEPGEAVPAEHAEAAVPAEDAEAAVPEKPRRAVPEPEVPRQPEEWRRAIEAVLMAAIEPVEPQVLAQLIERPVAEVEGLCALLAAECTGRGFVLVKVAGGYRFQTHPDFAPYVERYILEGRHARLSGPALETLAVIAYKQPVTVPEISEIRGVDSSGVIATLLDRKLITTAGRKAVIGRPILYKSTKEFLLRFGLKDVNELPSMEEFEKLVAESFQSEMPLSAPGAEVANSIAATDTADRAVAFDSESVEPRQTPIESAGVSEPVADKTTAEEPAVEEPGGGELVGGEKDPAA